MQGAQVQFLVGELRSHMLWDQKIKPPQTTQHQHSLPHTAPPNPPQHTHLTQQVSYLEPSLCSHSSYVSDFINLWGSVFEPLTRLFTH